MKAWGKIELGTVITISTAHITEKDAELLEKKFEQGYEPHEPKDLWARDIHIATSDYCYFFNLSSLDNYARGGAGPLPDWLAKALEMATDVGGTWLCFDRDGDEIEGLKVYDW